MQTPGPDPQQGKHTLREKLPGGAAEEHALGAWRYTGKPPEEATGGTCPGGVALCGVGRP